MNPAQITLLCIFAIMGIFLLCIGIFLLSDGYYEGIALLILSGVVLGVIYPAVKSTKTSTPEELFAEKQEAVINAQKELDKFLIDYPEFKEKSD